MSHKAPDKDLSETLERLEFEADAQRSFGDDEGLTGVSQTITVIRRLAREAGYDLNASQQMQTCNAIGTISEIVKDVCELPDRTSPEAEPDMLLVTVDVLELILSHHLSTPSKGAINE
ncbi:MAG: hypothetical protein K5905_19070 [Roseibium sp.]|uniref:hypothetical protein n=1 Tax=Roseibium sp. TaxID=1936156 RepID=UPI00262581C3|nr:hypothetical protein [Roseibium sp.]MCV0427566.1 hypothetical protein [Roseibium sp.]